MAKKQGKEKKQGEMRAYVVEKGQLFPFSMNMKQLEEYRKQKGK